MSNRNLTNYIRLSPNCTKPRNHAIDKITIHHMAGNLTVEQCGALFASESRKVGSNYGIGTDGRVGLCADESNRSWCSSNAANCHRTVTIEVANGGEVTTLQRLLRSRGFKGKNGGVLSLDGDFGSNTDYALRLFQKSAGLTVDGVCGKTTWAAILRG